MEDRPEGAEIPLDLDKVVPNIHHDYSAIPLPTKAELKAFIATEKALHGRKYDPIWYIVDGKIAVNAQYLLTLIEALPDATEIYYNNTYDGWKKPLYIQSASGDAVLLAVNIHKRRRNRSMKSKMYVPYSKLSKKEKRKINAEKRGSWGEINPVTRKSPNPRAYNRAAEKQFEME